MAERDLAGVAKHDVQPQQQDAEDGDDDEDDGGVESDIVDLEDIAGKGPSRRSFVEAQSNGKLNGENGKLNGQKEMVTPVIRASLEKQV